MKKKRFPLTPGKGTKSNEKEVGYLAWEEGGRKKGTTKRAGGGEKKKNSEFFGIVLRKGIPERNRYPEKGLCKEFLKNGSRGGGKAWGITSGLVGIQTWRGRRKLRHFPKKKSHILRGQKCGLYVKR